MQATLQRKIVYAVVLLFLMILLYIVGRPSQVVTQTGGEIRSAPGGLLAQYRAEQEGLSEVQLGEIDPASSTIKLATFGMRGVAIALLWHQTEEKKKRHDWNAVVATANQIIFLEPHFVTIWDFLGWNLAYNASADFDDYRERYRWVIRGIDFLLTGLKKNQRSAVLHKKVGWTVSQKIGIADEVEQYRRLLKDDEAFGERHDCKTPSERDNWKLGRRWYHLGEDLVLVHGVSLENESGHVYFANSRLNLFNYAKWVRKDGIFGDEAMRAWNEALDEWKEFAHIELDTAIPKDGTFRVVEGTEVHRTSLDITDIVREEEKELLAELHNIVPGLKQTLAIERWKELGETARQQGSLLPLLETADELDVRFYPVEELQTIRAWLEENEPEWKARLTDDRNVMIPAEQRELRKIPAMLLNEEDRATLDKTNSDISQVQSRSLGTLRLTPTLLAQKMQEEEIEIDRELKRRARAIVGQLDGHKARTRYSDLFRGIVNYEARFKEVAVETTQQADDAQRIRYEARKAYYDGRLADSLNGWVAAMRKWDELLDLEEFKDRATDGDFVRDRIDIVEKFLIILDDSNKIFSDVSGDAAPLHRLMWHRVFNNDNTVETAVEALEYAKKEFEQVLAEADVTKRNEGLEKVEQHFATIAQYLSNMNYREKFMEYAPFFELRDRMLESVAYYIRSLEAQGKPLPEPLVMRSYIELMLRHDPAVQKANEIQGDTIPLLQAEKYEEGLLELDKAVSAWQAILEKYPLIAHDSTNPAYVDIVRLVLQYAEVLQAAEKPLPEDFPLKKFLR